MTRIGCLSIPVLPTVKEKDVGNAQLFESAAPTHPPPLPAAPALTPAQQEQGRRRALESLAKLKNSLRGPSSSST